jgi:hypothetical protein
MSLILSPNASSRLCEKKIARKGAKTHLEEPIL